MDTGSKGSEIRINGSEHDSSMGDSGFMQLLIIAIMGKYNPSISGGSSQNVLVCLSSQPDGPDGNHIVTESDQRKYNFVLDILVGKECCHSSPRLPDQGYISPDALRVGPVFLPCRG